MYQIAAIDKDLASTTLFGLAEIESSVNYRIAGAYVLHHLFGVKLSTISHSLPFSRYTLSRKLNALNIRKLERHYPSPPVKGIQLVQRIRFVITELFALIAFDPEHKPCTLDDLFLMISTIRSMEPQFQPQIDIIEFAVLAGLPQFINEQEYKKSYLNHAQELRKKIDLSNVGYYSDMRLVFDYFDLKLKSYNDVDGFKNLTARCQHIKASYWPIHLSAIESGEGRLALDNYVLNKLNLNAITPGYKGTLRLAKILNRMGRRRLAKKLLVKLPLEGIPQVPKENILKLLSA